MRSCSEKRPIRSSTSSVSGLPTSPETVTCQGRGWKSFEFFAGSDFCFPNSQKLL